MMKFLQPALVLSLFALFACSGGGNGKIVQLSEDEAAQIRNAQAMAGVLPGGNALDRSQYDAGQMTYQACQSQCIDSSGNLSGEAECASCAGLLGEFEGMNQRVDDLRGVYGSDIQNTFYGESPLHVNFASPGLPNPFNQGLSFMGSNPRAQIPFQFRSGLYQNDPSLVYRGNCHGASAQGWGRGSQEDCVTAGGNPESVAVWSYFMKRIDDGVHGASVGDERLVRTVVTELDQNAGVFHDYAPGNMGAQYDRFRGQLNIFAGLKNAGQGFAQGQRNQFGFVLGRLGQGLMRSFGFLRHRPMNDPCFEAQRYGSHPGYANACQP